MEKSIDQIKIKCAFTQEIPDKLELGQDVQITLSGSIVKTEVRDNQDGSVNLVFVFKPHNAEVVQT